MPGPGNQHGYDQLPNPSPTGAWPGDDIDPFTRWMVGRALGGLAAPSGFEDVDWDAEGGWYDGGGGGDESWWRRGLGWLWDKGKDVVGGVIGGAKDGIGALGGGNTAMGMAALGLIASQLYDQRQQRKSAEEFNQQRLDTLMAALGEAEGEWQRREPLRVEGQDAMLGALGSMQGFDPIHNFMQTMDQRAPGEFLPRDQAMGGGR